MAATGSFYQVLLPDRSEGFIPVSTVHSPGRIIETISKPRPLLFAPVAGSAIVAAMAPGPLPEKTWFIGIVRGWIVHSINTIIDMVPTIINLTSPAFVHEGNIPSKYTCDGENINPPLQIGELPAGTKTLALIVDDPDAPGGVYDHWVVWNIKPGSEIKEHSMPGISGMNSSGKTGYMGPCPPDREHRYFFYLFALDTDVDLPEVSTKGDLATAMIGHILGEGALMGKYNRK